MEKTINLDNNAQISHLGKLDISSKEEILITDPRLRKVYLFEPNGRLRAELNPDHDHPGLNWRPNFALFEPDGDILVDNNVPWGIRFDSTGNLKKIMPEEYKSNINVTFDSQGNIIGYNFDVLGNPSIIKMNPNGKELHRFGDFPEEFKSLLSTLRMGHGLVTDSLDNIYYTHLAAPEIYKYSPDGNHESILRQIPEYYSPVTEDMAKPERDGRPDTRYIINNSTPVQDLYLLNKDLLLLQYRLPEGSYGLSLIKTDGTRYIQEEIVTDRRIHMARDGKLYTLSFRHMEDDPNINQNAQILVYTLKN